MPEATLSLPAVETDQRRISTAGFLLQVSRPGLWTTTALFYLMPLGQSGSLHSRTFWIGLFYILFPLGLLLYGVNDIADARADLGNPRKGTYLFGSRGAAAQLRTLRWQIAVAQVPFLFFFFYVLGPRILWWFAAMLLAVGVYNAPRFGLKGQPPFDVLIQASYLLVFVLSSWLNGVPQLPWQTFLFGALFAMHSHIFGEVMDIEPDRLVRRRTTATVIGPAPSKFLIAAILVVESLLVHFYFHDAMVTGFLALGALWFVLDARLFWKSRNYTPFQMRLFLWGWNAVSVLGIAWNWSGGSLTQANHFTGN
jgi:4-hydroxybenzoate polyprenyltransferase